jgi:glycosyltransferase involved in cell wall biosynthesis
MHVFNAMFSRGLGGIEQAFVDYTRALVQQGIKVTALIHPEADIAPAIGSLHAAVERVRNFGQWDFLATAKLARMINSERQPDIILAHGNRAISLMRRASGGKIPVVAVCHNYHYHRALACDGAITITKHMRASLIEEGMADANVFFIPNMMNLPKPLPAYTVEAHEPFVLGAMARFVKKKGLNYFLEALKLLQEREIRFKAILAGSGAEEANLRKLTRQLGLEEVVEFPGWVNIPKHFFDSIDVFCLPSLHEPFGIILLESFLYGRPVITTDTEGPSEITEHNTNALVIPSADPLQMADAMEKLIKDEALRKKLAEGGRERLVSTYDMNIVSDVLVETLKKIRDQHRSPHRHLAA